MQFITTLYLATYLPKHSTQFAITTTITVTTKDFAAHAATLTQVPSQDWKLQPKHLYLAFMIQVHITQVHKSVGHTNPWIILREIVHGNLGTTIKGRTRPCMNLHFCIQIYRIPAWRRPVLKHFHASSCKIVSKQNERQLGVCIYSCTGAISQFRGEYLERVCTYSRCSTCEQAWMSSYTSCCLLCRHGNHVYSTPPEAHQLATQASVPLPCIHGRTYSVATAMEVSRPWQIMLA